jgi:glycosyltransferase involved in cell wall biosynthesis
VVVPVRDEAPTIEALLGDLIAQRRPAAEILVVDTGSRDDTVARVAAFSRRDARIRQLSAPGAYPGGGRNAAVRVVRTEWIAFVDAGIRVPSDWLERLLEPVDKGEAIDAVLGGFEPVVDTRFQRASALAYVSAKEPLPSGGSWRGYCLPSSAVRTSMVRSLHGFPEGLRCGEDLHFYNRLSLGARIGYAPGAIVHWSLPPNLRALWRRFRTYSEHALIGGLSDGWFKTVSRRYGLMLLSGPAIPIVAAFLLVGRAVVMQRRKPEWVDRHAVGRFRQVIEVATVLGAIDSAVWAGWWAWRRRGAPSADQSGPADLVRVPENNAEAPQPDATFPSRLAG